MRVLITRAEPAAGRTAAKLKMLGHEPLVLPIFQLVDTGEPLPTEKYEGVIFTSANALEVLAKRGWTPEGTCKTAYCVGKRTAKSAEHIGFDRCVVASGGGEALAQEIERLNLPKNNRFLYPTTPDRSFDLKERLGRSGYDVHCVDVYKTREILFPNHEVEEALRKLKYGAVLVYSARSAAYLAELIDHQLALEEISSISLIGISKTATNIMLKYPWHGVYVSCNPDEETMLQMLQEIPSA